MLDDLSIETGIDLDSQVDAGAVAANRLGSAPVSRALLVKCAVCATAC